MRWCVVAVGRSVGRAGDRISAAGRCPGRGGPGRDLGTSTASSFRDSFGEDYGIALADGPMAGLLARAIVVIGADGNVAYTELVPEIAQEPDYDAALAALSN